jgi:hypothetical protein
MQISSEILDFEAWIRCEGVRADEIRLKDFNGCRGVEARNYIRTSTCFLRVCLFSPISSLNFSVSSNARVNGKIKKKTLRCKHVLAHMLLCNF